MVTTRKTATKTLLERKNILEGWIFRLLNWRSQSRNYCKLYQKKNNRKLYGFESTNRSKHNLKAHIILVCKYKKKLIVRDVNESIKKSIRDIENKSGFEIIEMETDKDHIHLMIQYVPRFQFLQLLIVSNQ